MPKMVCGPKKHKKSQERPEKTQGRPEKPKHSGFFGKSPNKHTQLENGALADPLGVRGSNLVQKKGVNAENGLRPKKTQKKKPGTSRKNAGTTRKNTLNWKMTYWPIL